MPVERFIVLILRKIASNISFSNAAFFNVIFFFHSDCFVVVVAARSISLCVFFLHLKNISILSSKTHSAHAIQTVILLARNYIVVKSENRGK